jgi:hypothetical protein
LAGGEAVSVRKRLAVAILVLGCALGAGRATAQSLRYGEDLVWRLASPSDIRQASSIRAKLRKEVAHAEPLFVLSPLPFSEIPTAPDETPLPAKRPKQWYVPPFATIPPPLSPDASAEEKQEYEARMNEQAVVPSIWGDLPLQENERAKVSRWIAPRRVAPGEEFAFRIKEIPPPFSLRRYFDSDEDVFFQVAAYGGTTMSFTAEGAFDAMKQAAAEPEELQGIGKKAFLARIVVIDPASKPPKPPAIDGPPIPQPPPFAEIEPEDRARPDLVDSASAVALEAPSFREIPVADLKGKRISFPVPPKKYFPKGGEVKQSILVLVAYFQDESVTLSFAMEERMGTVQDLVDVAMRAQRKLREEVVAGRD